MLSVLRFTTSDFPFGMFKFALIFSGVRVIRSLDFCVMFVDRCLCFCAFSLAY